MGDGTVRAVPVFGSGGSSAKRVFCGSAKFNRKGRFRFRFRFLENADPAVPVLRSVPGKIGNGPNTVSESTVSNTELSEFFGAH